MRIFEIVKENVNLREAAELYGIDVNRYGKALCPFHNDRNPSLYVADDHRHTSLRCISIINNQTNRLVMMNSCAA